ncbi:MAG: hypothetical protein AAB779_01915, partial [Patescibacteria group bacterium]
VKPKPVQPFVSFFLDEPDMSGAIIRVPAHLNWGGDSPRLELDPDYSKITWRRNGQVVATGKDPWLELANGDTVVASAVSTSGIVYASAPEVFRVAASPPAAVFDPGDPGYHPKPRPQGVNQASDKVYSRRRAKTAVESVTWGQAKNRER